MTSVWSCHADRTDQRSPSIFLLSVLQHGLPHLDQTAPSILEKRNHLVDIGIARQLEEQVQRTGVGGPQAKESSVFSLAFSSCKRAISISSAERSSGTNLQAQPASLRLHSDTWPVRCPGRSAVGHGMEGVAAILTVGRHRLRRCSREGREQHRNSEANRRMASLPPHRFIQSVLCGAAGAEALPPAFRAAVYHTLPGQQLLPVSSGCESVSCRPFPA